MSVLFSLGDRELAWDLTRSQTTRPSTCHIPPTHVYLRWCQRSITHTQGTVASNMHRMPATHLQLLTSDRSNQKKMMSTLWKSLSGKLTT